MPDTPWFLPPPGFVGDTRVCRPGLCNCWDDDDQDGDADA